MVGQLAFVADFGTRNFHLKTKFDMKRKLKITIKDDHNHYALIEQVNNRENEINRGIFLDKDQYEQLRQYFVSGSVCDNCGGGTTLCMC